MKKSLAMGLIFNIFWSFASKNPEKLGVFLWQNHKKWVPFLFTKTPKYGYLLVLEKLPLNMIMGLELPSACPDQSKSEYPLQNFKKIIKTQEIS